MTKYKYYIILNYYELTFYNCYLLRLFTHIDLAGYDVFLTGAIISNELYENF